MGRGGVGSRGFGGALAAKTAAIAGDSEIVLEEASLLRIMRNYKSTSLDPSEQSRDGKICIVPHHKRPQENTSPYTPRIISIGPLHHGEPELQPMEDLKKKYLNNLLKRQQGKDYDVLLQSLLMAARVMEERARNFYELSSLEISSDDFVNILVIDGCFLIEFFRNTEHQQITSDELGWQLPLIKLDILLFENQIPFFVLEKLFHLFLEFAGETMVYFACSYVDDTEIILDKRTKLSAAFTSASTETKISKASHLLHLHHMIMFKTKSHSPSTQISSIMSVIVRILLRLVLIVTFPLVSVLRLCFAETTYRTKRTSAMELEEAGVKFRGSFGDLRFEKGTLFVPFLTLNHQSFCIFKNLLALKFYDKDKVHPYAHEYASFLSHLIKHRGDLKVMEKHNIIKGGRGEEESVQLPRDLVEGHLLPWPDQEVLRNELLEYCNKNRHLWRAKLMNDYFGNPWSILGFLVGIVLLVLTTLQTVFTMLSYYQQQRGG